jgi:heavy metal sensor kinase
MKSIRLSLLVYFLGLLAVALGAVFWLVYRTTSQTLMAKKATTAELIEARYKDRFQVEETKRNQAMLFQAQTLARLLQIQFHWQRLANRDKHVLGLIGAAAVPNGHVLFPAWAFQGFPTSWPFFDLARTVPITPEFRFKEEELLHQVDPQVAEYFQITSTWGSAYRSPSLVQAGRYLTFDRSLFSREAVLDWKFDQTELEPGWMVFRVILKAPTRDFPPMVSPPPPGRRRVPPGKRPESPRGPDRFYPPARSALFIQCAVDCDKYQAALDDFENQRDQELDELKAETEESLAALRVRLLGISLAAFTATVIGCALLVRFGLSPLKRLCDAVSRVSAKDFYLPINERRLPAELKPIVERLRQTLSELQRAFAREKQAAADISHELRTPVAALLATLDVALRRPRSSQEYRNVLEECRASGQQMSRLVERLLLLARLDAGVDHLNSEPVDVMDLAEQCTNLVRPLAQARGLALKIHGECPAMLNTDPAKLCEILTNLLHNAIEYNRPDGSVDLTVASENGSVRLEVRDTGIGITPEARAHLFERFFRADPSRQADSLHAGLGLAIVKGYVELMGGSLEVESTVGQGSVFCVKLPRRGEW